jgi:uncharacterized damage-inducible protein DinB
MTSPMIGRDVPALLDERATVAAVLDSLRETVVRKVAGLTQEQAMSRPSPPSTMTPLGLVKHLTAVERWWFGIDFAGLDVPQPWPDGDDSYDGFELTDEDTVDGVLRAYQDECAASRDVVARHLLDEHARQPPGRPFNLRYAMVHMLEETARHCGHLDLMREAIDGTRGE